MQNADVAEVAAPYMKTKTVIEAIITTKNINDSAITIKTTKDSKTNEEVRDLSFKETNTQETFEKVSEEKVPQFELKGGTTEIIATEMTLVNRNSQENNAGLTEVGLQETFANLVNTSNTKILEERKPSMKKINLPQKE